MKKILALMLFVVALGFSSCSEYPNLNIDFGKRTNINDYADLVTACNDLSNRLQTRFEALDSLIDVGMANIALSFNENSGALLVLSSTTKDGLDAINTQIFNGFNALTVQMATDNETLINSIDKNGNLLRLHLDSLNNVLSTTIINNNNALLAALKNDNDSLNAKLALIKASVAAGFTTQAQAQAATETAILALKDQVAADTVYYKQMMTMFNAFNTNMAAINTALGVLSKNDTTMNTTIVTMATVLKKLLSSDGVQVGADGKSLYLSPTVWNLVQSKDQSSGLYRAFTSGIKTATSHTSVPLPPEKYRGWLGIDDAYLHTGQRTSSGVTDSLKLAFSQFRTNSDSLALVIEGSLTSTTSLLRLVKMPAYADYVIQPQGGDSDSKYKYFRVRVYDARGDYQVFGDRVGPKSLIDRMSNESTAAPSASYQSQSKMTIRLKIAGNGKVYSDDMKVYMMEYNSSKSSYPALSWPSTLLWPSDIE